MNLAQCLKKIGSKISQQDQKEINAAYRERRRMGMDRKEAARRVIDDRVDELMAERAEVEDIIKKAGIKPKPVEKIEKAEAKPETTAEVAAKTTPSSEIAQKVEEYLTKEHAEPLNIKKLRSWAFNAFGGTLSQGSYSVKDLYDAMELGVNQAILKKGITANEDISRAHDAVSMLKRLIVRLPTQTSRTEESDEFQQFSTPPPLAYVANWVANIGKNDVFMEPSAGVGGIAIFAKKAGAAKIVVNELSQSRFELLKHLPFDVYTKEDAAQLNNLEQLKDIKTSVVVMNPPFSATAGRVQGRRSTMEGAAHVEQALKKLLTNGRLVAIVGQGMARDKPAFRDWWNKVEAEYNVKANIGISGQEYRKYGTTFDNQILVIDKTGPTENKEYPQGKVEKIADLIPLLKEVRDERIPQRERIAGESDLEKGFEESRVRLALLPAGGKRGDRVGRAEGEQPAVAGEPGGIPVHVEPGERDEVSRRGARPDERYPGEPEPGTGRERDTSAARQQAVSGADRISAAERSSGELQITAIKKEASGEFSESHYESYKPERMKIEGSVGHPSQLVQSAAMSAVSPPKPTYEISIPKKAIESGKLSDIQVEPIVYAGQAHENKLPNGTREGFFVGDGTGVGKGRIIAGVLWDNWNKGRKKGVWISEKGSLLVDAQRDVTGAGWDKNVVFPWNKIKSGVGMAAKEGILFGTYDTLKSAPKKEDSVARIDQLVNWLGKDFDGVIVFDESHNMGNAIAMRGERGTVQPSAKALAGVDLQERMPNARILYVSATGATEVRNLSYTTRLGLWGEGTPFPNTSEFINEIAGGGVASMEMIAQNMKATGSYTARSLSYDGVKVDRIEHKLSKNQRDQYNKAAGAWRTVLENINEALEITGGAHSGPARSNAMGLFWGTNQRFFNQVITGMQLPSVIDEIHKDLKDEKSVVIQLVNTLDAAQERALARLNEEDSLEDLDLSPFDDLMQMVERGFPVQQYHEVMDDRGNVRMVPTLDSAGDHVLNSEAVGLREQLLDELGALRGNFADGVIDQIIAEFGADNVAEVTGRKRRVVDKITERGTEKVIEKRSEAKVRADVDAYMGLRKRILIFSEKGGTGSSYDSDRDVKNQQQRSHYLLQPGWRADKAIQGLGRTHRANQVHPPQYHLVTTDLKGQARFVSSIARRLDQLGALTKGARETGSQGIFQAKDNLETEYASDALQVLLRDIYNGDVPNFTVADFEKQTAIRIVDRDGNLMASQVNTRKFLNRILSMDVDKQNELFSEFSIRMDEVIDAHAEAGTLDVGLETLKADKIEKAGDEVVHTDKRSGANTRYVQLDVTNPSPILHWDKAKEFAATDGFYQNIKSGKVWAARKRAVLNRNTGDINDKYTLQSPTFTKQSLDPRDLEDQERWTKLSSKEAEDLWNDNVAELPRTITERRHLVTGVLLPIWNRLVGHPRIMRVRTDDGEAMIGRLISPKDLRETLKRLGATAAKIKASPKEIHTQIIGNGYRYNLANGWSMQRKRVAGDYRIEIDGPSYNDFNILKNYGVFSERIYYQTRYFIPADAKGQNAIEKIIANAPVVDEIPPHGQYQIGEAKAKLPSKKPPNITGTPESIQRGFDQVKEAIDLFGEKRPGQQALFATPEPAKQKRERAKKKVKRPPREAQLDLFTGKAEHAVQPGLFKDFVKKPVEAGKKALRVVPGKKGIIQGAGQWVEISPTGRVFEAPSAAAKNAGEVASILQSIGKQSREVLYTVTVGKDGTILEIFEHSRGAKTASTSHPIEIAGHILNIPNASKVYFAHNHPSGDTTASPEDVAADKMVRDILSLKDIESDGFVIGGNKWRYVSHIPSEFEEEIQPVTGKEKIAAVETILKGKGPGKAVNNSVELKELLADKYDNQEGIVFFNAKNREIGFLPWPSGDTIKKASAQILAVSEHLNASAYAINLNKPVTYKNRAGFIGSFGHIFKDSLTLHEVLEQGRSWADNGLIRGLLRSDRDFAELRSEEILYERGKAVPVVGNDPLIDLVRKLPFLAKQAVGLSPDGSVWVRTKSGEGFTVKSVESINPDEISLNIHYGQMLESGEFLKGKYQDGTIDLVRSLADEWTLAHETVHWLEDIGLINKKDVFTLENRIKAMAKKGQWDSEGRPVGGVEDRAVFISEKLRDRSLKGPVRQILQKIADFVDALINLVKSTARGLVRKIESGKIFERPGGRPQTTVPAFQKTADRWHSQMRKYLFMKLTNGRPEVLAGQIESWAKKGLIKQEELEWSGVLEWLGEQKGKVSKQDVLDYLAVNNVRVEEVVKGEDRQKLSDRIDEIDALLQEEGISKDEENRLNAEFDRLHAEYKRLYEDTGISISADTKFGQYVLPGGKDYRELLLTLPTREVGRSEERVKADINSWLGLPLRASVLSKKVALNRAQTEEERSALLGLYDELDAVHERPHILEQTYKASHWEEPNVLAHIRFDERTGPDGEKVLHLAEIQSDWGSEMRKQSQNIEKDVESNFKNIVKSMEKAGVLEEIC